MTPRIARAKIAQARALVPVCGVDAIALLVELARAPDLPLDVVMRWHEVHGACERAYGAERTRAMVRAAIASALA